MQRSRRLTPLTLWIIVGRIGVAVSFAVAVVNVLEEIDSLSRIILSAIGITLLFTSLRLAGAGISVAKDALLISGGGLLGFSRVPLANVERVEWRHNLQAFTGSPKRLWVVLDDGQAVASPVVTGGLTWFITVRVNDDKARELTAELERLVAARR